MISFLKSLITPNPEINYTVITLMYTICFLLGLFFYVLEKWLLNTEKGHWSRDNLDQVEGVYIIFMPFFPCVFWSLGMKYLSKKSALGSEGGKSKDDKKVD